MPLYRDAAANEPNVTQDLLATLSENLGIEITAQDLLAYVYSLGATPAFSEAFRRRTGGASWADPRSDYR